MAIRAVLMDIGGVVIVNTATETDFEVMAEKFGAVIGVEAEAINSLRKQHLREMMTGRYTTSDFFSDLGKQTGKPLPENIEQLWVDTIVPELKVNHELLSWVDHTREHCRVVVFSTVSDLRVKLDRKLGIYCHFDEVFLSLDYGVTKYNPEFFEKTLAKLKVSPDEALLIDDQLINISRAANLGINGLEYRPCYINNPQSFEAAVSAYEFNDR